MIFISTTINDIHAAAVYIYLRDRKIPCVRWISSDFPSKQHAEISFNEGNYIRFHSEADEREVSLNLNDLDVVWNRRLANDLVPNEGLNAADQKVAMRESESFVLNFAAMTNTANRKVNDLYSARRAENKSLQLAEAKRVGFMIPTSIITNNPQTIRKFLNDAIKNRVIAKPFRPSVWRNESDDWVNHAALVTTEQLPSDEALSACPIILQEYVEKKYEVRVTCFGNTVIAARLDSQKQSSSKIDWRATSPGLLDVQPISIPQKVKDCCLCLMRKLDLNFGCFDLVVTPEDSWMFLEINQMGQFLWVEEANSDMQPLGHFANYLHTGGGATTTANYSFKEIMHEAAQLLKSEEKLRVRKPVTNMFNEQECGDHNEYQT